jgi:hypothetical protein
VASPWKKRQLLSKDSVTREFSGVAAVATKAAIQSTNRILVMVVEFRR